MRTIHLIGLALLGSSAVQAGKRNMSIEDHGVEYHAAVTRDNVLLVGRRRLHRVRRLDAQPSGVVAGLQPVVWFTKREGLWLHTHLEILDRWGEVVQDQSFDAPIEDGLILGTHLYLLLPGELVDIDLESQKLERTPLPLLRPAFLEWSELEQRLLIHGTEGPPITFDPDSRCPEDVPDTGTALERQMAWVTRNTCANELPLSKAIEAQAHRERKERIQAAIQEGDASLLAGLGIRGRDAIEALRPSYRVPELGGYKSYTNRIAPIPVSLLTPNGAVILYEPTGSMSLEPWTQGSYAPACAANLVVVPEDAQDKARLTASLQARRLAGDRCARAVTITDPGGLIDMDLPVMYISATQRLLAARSGPVSPSQARLDIARLTSGDPLNPWATPPTLTPAWTIQVSGQTFLAQDVDGSWIAHGGWEIVRGDHRGSRIDRIELMGPLTSFNLREDGQVEVIAGGQPTLVDLDWHRTHTSLELAIQPEPLGRTYDPGEWRIDQNELIRPGTENRPTRALPLPMKVLHIEEVGTTAILSSPLGLYGISGDMKLVWRAPAADDWVVSEGVLITTTRWGITGYQLPL